MRGMIAALAFVAWAGSSYVAHASELSYHGWKGDIDVINGRFAGCHLDSPPPMNDGINNKSPMRVVAASSTEFFLQTDIENFQFFRDSGSMPQQGAVYRIKLATLDDHPLNAHKENWVWPFEARVLEARFEEPSQLFIRTLIRIDAESPLMEHFKEAQFLYFKWLDGGFGMNMTFDDVLSLKHRAIDNPDTWLGIFDTNDTYGAIQTVLDCARQHGISG